MYRVGVESILGLRRSGNAFTVDPCIPASWPGYEMRWRVQGTEYRISVENPAGHCRGVLSVVVDGVEEPTRMVPLVQNGGTRHVRVVLGMDAHRARHAAQSGDIVERDLVLHPPLPRV